jgi:hypothetical protein
MGKLKGAADGGKVARELNRSSVHGLNKKVIAEYLHLEA